MKKQNIIVLFVLFNNLLAVRKVVIVKKIYTNCSIFDMFTNLVPFIDCLETGQDARSLWSIEKHT